MQMMLYQLLKDGRMDIPHIEVVAPWFEAALLRGSQFITYLPSPRIFKTHLTLAELPKKARCIYMLRNPKDSCVSYYHHLTSLEGLYASIPEFGKMFLEGKTRWGSWFKHLTRCANKLKKRDVLLVNYDDLCADLPAVVDRVAAFCGQCPDERKRSQIVERCSVDFMKQYNQKFDASRITFRVDPTPFIRKGVSKDWIACLPPNIAGSLDDRLKITLRRLARSTAERLMFLESKSSLRGTVFVQNIDWRNGDRFLFTHEGPGIPVGVILRHGHESGVSVGDQVRLVLQVNPLFTMPIDVAEVININHASSKAFITFQFLSMSATVQQAFKQFISHADTAWCKVCDHTNNMELLKGL